MKWAWSSSSTMFQSISFFGPSKKPSRETWTKRITFLIASSPAVAKASGAPRDYTGAGGLPLTDVMAGLGPIVARGPAGGGGGARRVPSTARPVPAPLLLILED